MIKSLKEKYGLKTKLAAQAEAKAESKIKVGKVKEKVKK